MPSSSHSITCKLYSHKHKHTHTHIHVYQQRTLFSHQMPHLINATWLRGQFFDCLSVSSPKKYRAGIDWNFNALKTNRFCRKNSRENHLIRIEKDFITQIFVSRLPCDHVKWQYSINISVLKSLGRHRQKMHAHRQSILSPITDSSLDFFLYLFWFLFIHFPKNKKRRTKNILFTISTRYLRLIK